MNTVQEIIDLLQRWIDNGHYKPTDTLMWDALDRTLPDVSKVEWSEFCNDQVEYDPDGHAADSILDSFHYWVVKMKTARTGS